MRTLFPTFRAAAFACMALTPPFLQSVVAQGRIVQSLEAFFTPAAVAASPDGRILYVTNAARGEMGMMAGRGAVSKVRVGGEAKLTVEAARFISGLSSPLGIAVLPGPIGTLPEGALVVAVGGSWTVDENGQKLDPREAGAGLAFFDAPTGRELGRIYLGRGAAVEGMVGHVILDPTTVAADLRGNLYVADVAGARFTAQRTEGLPGIVKLSADAVTALLRTEAPPAGSVAFAPVDNIPVGITYSLEQDALYCVTGDGVGALGGAVFRLAKGDFSGMAALETAAKELNSLAGIAFSPAGKILACRTSGDIVYLHGRGRARAIKLRPEYNFLSPGQPVAVRAANGSVILVVPELAGAGLGTWRHRVQVVELPADF